MNALVRARPRVRSGTTCFPIIAIYRNGQDASCVALSWTAPAGQVDGYEILCRRPKQGENELQTLVSNTGSSATSYTDTTATEPGERYFYRVKAIRNGVRSQRSNFAKADRP